MRRLALSVGLASIVVGGCASGDTAPPDALNDRVESASEPSPTSVAVPEASSTTSTTTTSTTTTSTTSTTTTSTTSTTSTTTTLAPTVEAFVELDAAGLLAVLDTLTVEAEPPRAGYNRDLFPHWNDTNGTGCTARQDALLAQVVGLPQIDLFDRCVIVEGDWYSLFDGETHSGAPGDIDVDHVVALAEAWDSGASEWPLELRRQFANDPINLLVVTRQSNQSKSDRDAGEWRPPQRDAWCFTAAVKIHTKARYELSVDPLERDGLAEMASTCDEPGQQQIRGVPLPGTPEHGDLPPVVVPPPTTTTVPPAADDSDCAPGQVNINTAPESELLRIIHIGPERAADLVRLRPFSSVRSLTRINGIGDAKIRDIIEQGVACA